MTSKKDSTSQTSIGQDDLAKALEIASKGVQPSKAGYDIGEPIPEISYDMVEIEDFLNVVFHAIDEDSHVLTWKPSTHKHDGKDKNASPRKPSSEDKLYRALGKTKKPSACYFGTSSVVKHETDGKLYNRKSQFSALHVVVLDDIGTKIPLAKIPKILEPNYIIESSPNNFQYGYILKEPITSLELAEALIHVVYTSGLSDAGGKMPTKIVRLPCGVNGKLNENRYFNVKLRELNDNYWTPEQLLSAMDVGISWQSILEDVNNAKGGKSSMTTGTSLYSAVPSRHASLSGVVDQTLEWLYENNHVINDNGEWVEVPCPWADEHTSGGNTAGYSPIGRGGVSPKLRGFHCFHGHCSANKITQYLQYLAGQGAPEVPVFDAVADLVADYAFIQPEDSVARIRGVRQPTFMKMGAFNNAFPQTARIFDISGKIIKQAESSMWRKAPNRLSLAGRLYDPTSKLRIIDHDNQKYLNTYTHPQWGEGDFNEADVLRFKEFLEYLIPVTDEREYFWEWLAAKAQNPTFKGAALLMVAPNQGTGRTTLTDMVTELFTHANVSKVTFSQLLASGDAGTFNGWVESSIVTCDEVMSKDTSKYHTYETLKDMFDPRPKKVKVNEKYSTERSVTLYTSYIMLTNHTAAIGALGDDRRVYVISNTLTPESPRYFTDLNNWLAEKDAFGDAKWARSVWRFLQTLKPDVEKLNSPAPNTYGKEAMVADTKSLSDSIIDAVLEEYEFCVPLKLAKELACDVLQSITPEKANEIEPILSRVLKDRTDVIRGGNNISKITISGKTYKTRANRLTYKTLNIHSLANLPDDMAKAYVLEGAKAARYITENYHGIVEKVTKKVEDLGY